MCVWSCGANFGINIVTIAYPGEGLEGFQILPQKFPIAECNIFSKKALKFLLPSKIDILVQTRFMFWVHPSKYYGHAVCESKGLAQVILQSFVFRYSIFVPSF